jgi:hypothetical protein
VLALGELVLARPVRRRSRWFFDQATAAEVNDQILRMRIAKETEPLRNLVFALAFSQTGLVEGDAEGPT